MGGNRSGAGSRAIRRPRLLRSGAGGPPSAPSRNPRRYDRRFRHTTLVQRTFVRIIHVPTSNASPVANNRTGLGFFISHNGSLYRRHSDIRQAAPHLPGSRRAASRVNKVARAHRGLRFSYVKNTPRRVHFPSAAAHSSSPQGRGLPYPGEPDFDPVLDYSAIAYLKTDGFTGWHSVLHNRRWLSPGEAARILRKKLSGISLVERWPS